MASDHNWNLLNTIYPSILVYTILSLEGLLLQDVTGPLREREREIITHVSLRSEGFWKATELSKQMN